VHEWLDESDTQQVERAGQNHCEQDKPNPAAAPDFFRFLRYDYRSAAGFSGCFMHG
jgi:hypothetical protein